MSYPNISKNTEWKIREKRNEINDFHEKVSLKSTPVIDKEDAGCELSSDYRKRVEDIELRMQKLDEIYKKWDMKTGR